MAYQIIIWASFVGMIIEADEPERGSEVDLSISTMNSQVFRHKDWDALTKAIKENAREIFEIIPKRKRIKEPVFFILPGDEALRKKPDSPQLDLWGNAA